MFQLNVPKKTSALIQVWASVVLIVAALIMSFTPIITLETAENTEAIEETLKALSGAEDIEVPKKVGITAPGLVSSTKLMFDMISALSDKNTSNNQKLEALEKKLESKEGQKAILTAAALMNTIGGVFGSDDDGESTSTSSSSGLLQTLFSIMLVISVVMGVLGLTLALPVIFIVIALTAIIPALVKMKNPEIVAPKIGGKLTALLSLPLTLMLFQGVVSGMSYGIGTIAIMIIAILSVLLSTVISRFTQYNEKQFVYINLVQGASVLGIVGFLIFFFNLLKTNIFSRFTGGTLFGYITKVTNMKKIAERLNETIETQDGYVVDIILIALYVSFILIALSYLEMAARRLSCTSKKGDSLLTYAILALPVFILPTIVKNTKNYYLNPLSTEDKGDASFLVMSGREERALAWVLVGIIIMIVAEVALIVLKKVLCKDMTELEMKAVVTGEVLAAADAPKEAPAVEATAQETVEEAAEAPAEETAVELEEETTSQN